VKEPTTLEELREMHKILRSDPQRYLQITNDWIRENPCNSHAYFTRHFGWMKIGEPWRAIEDLDKVIALDPSQTAFVSRGAVYRDIGEYRKAIEDFDRGEQLKPPDWEDELAILYLADCHARLGDESAAVANAARLPDDFWTPGLDRAPAGNKAEVIDELRRIAARAQRQWQ
jgi:tetratricopeptide (TPR) repeat protein